MKSIHLRVKYIILIKPQLKRIYLKFWQIYLILCFEVNKHKFSRELGIFCVKCIFWKVNIIDIFNLKNPKP